MFLLTVVSERLYFDNGVGGQFDTFMVLESILLVEENLAFMSAYEKLPGFIPVCTVSYRFGCPQIGADIQIVQEYGFGLDAFETHQIQSE